jgi:hypothetical protein
MSTLTLRADAESILYIGRLDRDAVPDTIVGIPSGELRRMPVAIRWGTSETDVAAAQTTLAYPAWASLEGSCGVVDINADGADDVVVYFNAQASDSARAVVLLGQHALRRAAVIDLAAVPRGIQWRPFVALDLVALECVRDAAERDLSGDVSYVLRSLKLPPIEDAPGNVAIRLPETIAAFPNPASNDTRLTITGLEARRHRLELADVDGRLVWAKSFDVVTAGRLECVIDLRERAAGVYVARLVADDHVIVAYPVVVVR